MGLIELLRSLQSRIAKLEGQNNGSRRNAIRIGNVVVSNDPDINALSIQDLATGEAIPLGVPRDGEWSFSGFLAVSNDDSDYGPPYTLGRDGVAIEITLSTRTVATTDIDVKVWFDDGRISKTVTLPAGTQSTSVGVNIPLGRGSLAYPQLISNGTDGRDLGVVVRFGSPRGATTSSED
jgi:hypothetical protein